jgi:hypothetical protein
MKLKHCKLGEVVTDGKRIGHIVGFESRYELQDHAGRVDINNINPLVRFGGEFKDIGIHMGNIEIYKGGL